MTLDLIEKIDYLRFLQALYINLYVVYCNTRYIQVVDGVVALYINLSLS